MRVAWKRLCASRSSFPTIVCYMATFTCANCGHIQRAPDEWVNRRAICPKCNARSVIKANGPEIVEPLAFDESQTFAYKGDFLGMGVREFTDRHDQSQSSDFKYMPSTLIEIHNYSDFGFEDWMRGSDRLIQYSASGKRLTIVGLDLAYGVYTFVDGSLSSITLTLRQPTLETYMDLLPALHGALNEPPEVGPELESVHVTTWKRPMGALNLTFIPFIPSLNVIYVNLGLQDAFNRLRTQLTGSRDL
jgi:hypothetical protein